MKSNKGFTLIELLVVISIVSLLSSVVFVSLNSAREKAGVAKILEQINQVRIALELYGTDTGHYPSVECTLSCTQAGDPFLNSLGVSGWNGPYLPLWDMAHYWDGHVGISPSAAGGALDWDDDGILECTGLFLDDDRPQTDWTDNGGRIPANVLLEIDKKLDDGNLATGDIRGNGNGWTHQVTAIGELVIVMGCY